MNHKQYSANAGGAGGSGQIMTGGKATISVNGKPVVFAHNAHYTVQPILKKEIYALCKLLALLNIKAAKKYYTPQPQYVRVSMVGGGGGGSGQLVVSEKVK